MIITRLELDNDGDDWLLYVRLYHNTALISTIACVFYMDEPHVKVYTCTSLARLMVNVNDDCYWVDEFWENGKRRDENE